MKTIRVVSFCITALVIVLLLRGHGLSIVIEHRIVLPMKQAGNEKGQP
jgi:hypothetical protein